MWTCPRCERVFKSTNQSHYCNVVDIDDLFKGKPPELLLAFDKLLVEVIDWEPCGVGAAKKAIVFSSQKAWLIVRPMSKELDLKFYYGERIENEQIKKVQMWGKKFAHHIRVNNEYQLTEEVFQLLKKGHTFSMK